MMDNKILKELAIALEAMDFSEIEKRFGLRLSFKRFSCDPGAGTAEAIASFAHVEEDGTATTPEAAQFKRYATHFGLSPDDLYRTYKRNGVRYQIVGMDPNNSSYPVFSERIVDGAIIRVSAESVAHDLRAKADAS
jgi:hypothetical protein